jgi:hypothetical protein
MLCKSKLRWAATAAIAIQLGMLSCSTALAQGESEVVGTWKLSRDELKYVTPTASSGGVATVTWRRAR